MADETLTCFTSLLESLPTWISDLEHLSKTVVERQNALIAEHNPSCDEPRVLSRRKSKTSSLNSRPEGEVEGEAEGNTQHASRAEQSDQTLVPPRQQQPQHLETADALRLAQRKRKTASACSGQRSGPTKFRSRGLVVLYYDGETQKRFEGLVRAVGTSRNSLRKGKMSAKVHALARSGSSGSEESEEEGEVLDANDTSDLKGGLQKDIDAAFKKKDDGTQVFDKMDSFLEKAQALCEKAAHQVLRDGDCTTEVATAKQRMQDARILCEAELPTIRKLAEKSERRRRRSDERRRVRAEQDKNRERSTPGPKDGTNEKVLAVEDPFSSPASLEVDLEAGSDSDSDGQDDFDIASFQMGKFHQMRRTRLTAM